MLEELYRDHYEELVRFCRGIDSTVAEDMAQEAFLKALQNESLLEELSANQRRAWLYRTVKNQIWDRLRRRKLEQQYLQTAQADAAAPEAGYQAAENRLLLDLLGPQERMLFWMRYAEGYSARELSELLGIPSGTIRAKLSRARSVLKNELRK